MLMKHSDHVSMPGTRKQIISVIASYFLMRKHMRTHIELNVHAKQKLPPYVMSCYFLSHFPREICTVHPDPDSIKWFWFWLDCFLFWFSRIF